MGRGYHLAALCLFLTSPIFGKIFVFGFWIFHYFLLKKLTKTTSHNFWERLFFWQLSFRIKKHILGVISHWPNLCIWWWEVPPKVLQEPEKRRQRRILAGVKTIFWLRRNNYYICFPFAQGHRHVCLRLQLLWADGLQGMLNHMVGLSQLVIFTGRLVGPTGSRLVD